MCQHDQGHADKGLTLKVGPSTPGAITRATIIANAAKWEECAEVRFKSIECFKGSGQMIGRTSNTGDHVHPNGGLTNGPEPEAFGEASFSKKSPGHITCNTPV